MTNQTRQLFHIIIRLNKEDSAFFYFQLEANDGIAFYSTLEYPHHAQYRDIELRGDLKLRKEVIHILDYCSLKFKIETLVDETIIDK
jgi:hypothetical protein